MPSLFRIHLVRASLFLLLSWLGVGAGPAWAHGYVVQPESRAALCRSGGNSDCGAVQYEPQSLEGLSGFPAQGSADGSIASAALPQFSALDEQSAGRWRKVPFSAGEQVFRWMLTANHVTRNFRYYITKPDWNPNFRLSRVSFESTPFCHADGGMQRPPKDVSHTCQVPARSGYQIILAVWEVGDTARSFYSTIDVQFPTAGSPTAVAPTAAPAWPARGSIYPSMDLQPGDQVATRVFDAQGERSDLQTRLTIGSVADGQRNTWSYLLAGRINATQARTQRAGRMAGSGEISPVQGQNEVHAPPGSGIQTVEVQITKAVEPADVIVSGLASRYDVPASGRLDLRLQVTTVGNIDLHASLVDTGGKTLAVASAARDASGQGRLSLSVTGASAGGHQLVVKGTNRATGALVQRTYALEFTGGIPASGSSSAAGPEQRFPQGLSTYTAGTRVFQPKTGRSYECRPFPYSGYCVQWSPGATQYEPGIGSHWQMAWLLR